jgi:hypothetical protein
VSVQLGRRRCDEAGGTGGLGAKKASAGVLGCGEGVGTGV